jgi:hypothetical protein
MHSSPHQTDHFDLLPFIAILMCVLGCLLLVTVSMSAISMGIGAGEAWIPAAKDSDSPATKPKKPILVEWDGEHATFHLDEGRNKVAWQPTKGEVLDGLKHLLSSDAQKGSKGFQSILDMLRARKETHYVLIAVRPSGFGDFRRFAAEFRNRGITIGYEPIDQARAVRLMQDVNGSHR